MLPPETVEPSSTSPALSLAVATMVEQNPASRHINSSSSNSLSTLPYHVYPQPDNSLVGLLSAAYCQPPSSIITEVPSVVQPLQIADIMAIVDDVLRELDDDVFEE
jgi:hypothetical protein